MFRFDLSSSRLLALAVALLAGATAIQAAEEVRLSARPGTVVRWSAPETSECSADGRSFKPHGEICYFPVDLERKGEFAIERVRAGATERAMVTIGDYPYTVQKVTLPTDKHVDLSKDDLARSEAERKRIDALWARDTERRFELPIAGPLARLQPQASFGKLRIFNGQPRSPHGGEDYRATTGAPVLAAANGVVALAEEHFFGGNSVFLDHGDGLFTMYLHLSKILVEPGAQVHAGDRIGLVGATGRASGPHLHFGVRWRGARVDPAVLLAAD